MVSDTQWDALMTDVLEAFGREVTLRIYTSGSRVVNAVTGAVTNPYVDLLVMAHKLPRQQPDIATGPGLGGGAAGAEGNAVRLSVATASLTTLPKAGDLVLDTGDYVIAKVEYAVNERETILICRNTRTG